MSNQKRKKIKNQFQFETLPKSSVCFVFVSRIWRNIQNEALKVFITSTRLYLLDN